MEKLILRYSSDDDYGTIPFTYESKEKFISDVKERFKDEVWEYYTCDHSKYRTSKVEVFSDVWLCQGEIENLEKSVDTLDVWFKKNNSISLATFNLK